MKRLISVNEDMEIVGETVNGQQAMQRLKEHNADVLRLAICMPGGNFLDTMPCVRTELPHVRILVQSVHPEEIYAIRAFKIDTWWHIQ